MRLIPESFAGVATAATRVIELYTPKNQRLFDDQIGYKLLPPGWKVFLRFFYLPGLRSAVLALRERRMPGSLGGILLRTRYIDDLLIRSLAKGLEQVVILGAGFDTRAYRLPGIDQVQVFEVDLPGTGTLKRKRLTKVLGAVPDHVTLVGINFDQQNLADVLAGAGFKKGKKTFFIWEGVTQYLTEEAVKDTLEFVSGASGPGSGIVFTYIRRALLEGIGAPEWFPGFLGFAEKVGSPIKFGLNPQELGGYLLNLGLTLISDVGAEEYQDLYLKPVDRELSIFNIERAAYAEVRG